MIKVIRSTRFAKLRVDVMKLSSVPLTIEANLVPATQNKLANIPWRLLNATSFPPGEAYTGVRCEKDGEDNGLNLPMVIIK